MLYSAMYLGPDDKLYIGNWNGLSDAMSVIDNPNNKGSACNFCARCLRFPTFYYSGGKITGVASPPCMPNYKLGAINPPCWVTGVEDEPEQKIDFNVYPNPTTGIVTIQCYLENGKTAVFELRDLYGRRINKTLLKSHQATQTIHIGNHTAGIYFYSLTINGVQSESGKLILIK